MMEEYHQNNKNWHVNIHCRLSPLYILKVEDYSIIDTNIIIEDISFEISVSIQINDFYHDYDDELCGAL